jgi:hypothetical protein
VEATQRVGALKTQTVYQATQYQAQGEMADAIEFVAEVQKVQTLVDGGLRVTLDLPETAIVEAAWLMTAKREGVPVCVRCEPDEARLDT